MNLYSPYFYSPYYYISNNPYDKNKLSLYDIKKILKADGDINKKFKDEIYGYKLYELDPDFGAKYSSLKSSFMIISTNYYKMRYFVIVKVRCKMPILYPMKGKFIFTKDDLAKVYKEIDEYNIVPDLRTICLVNEAIVDINTGVPINDFPTGFKKKLELFPAIRSCNSYGKHELYTRLNKYVFPDYFEINTLDCDHGLHFFLTKDNALEFAWEFCADSIGYMNIL